MRPTLKKESRTFQVIPNGTQENLCLFYWMMPKRVDVDLDGGGLGRLKIGNI